MSLLLCYYYLDNRSDVVILSPMRDERRDARKRLLLAYLTGISRNQLAQLTSHHRVGVAADINRAVSETCVPTVALQIWRQLEQRRAPISYAVAVELWAYIGRLTPEQLDQPLDAVGAVLTEIRARIVAQYPAAGGRESPEKPLRPSRERPSALDRQLQADWDAMTPDEQANWQRQEQAAHAKKGTP